MERYPGIKEKINEGNWAQAVEELEHCFAKKEWNDELAILAATVAAAEGESELAYDYISRGLQYNYKNYELYFMLGSYYEKRNVNQAWLCCENAEYYCDSAEDREVIRQYRKMLEQGPDWCVKKTSIVILTYNNKKLSMQCLDSIRQTTPASSYEIVVVDNASTDGTPEWLREQSDVKCICNTENKGFPEGCNQGIRISEPDHNIFLLNNDTVVLPNSIFWLRMGLYEDDRVGAVGSMTNYASNGQQIEENDVSAGENAERWLKINRPMRHPYEKKSWLVGYALLIRRKALDETGLLDTRFFPGQNEDLDLGLRLNQAGWRTVLCHNSFIIHYGHGGGKNLGLWSSTMADVNKKLTEKWGSDQLYYMWARQEIIDLIDAPRTEPIAVLEIGCGYGATLARIEYLWQHAKVKGIELNETVAGIAGNYLDILPGNIETM